MKGKERVHFGPGRLVVGAALTESGLFGVGAPFGGKTRSPLLEVLTKEIFSTSRRHKYSGGRQKR